MTRASNAMETITRNTSNQSISQTTALSCDITSLNPLARVGGGIVGARNKVFFLAEPLIASGEATNTARGHLLYTMLYKYAKRTCNFLGRL